MPKECALGVRICEGTATESEILGSLRDKFWTLVASETTDAFHDDAQDHPTCDDSYASRAFEWAPETQMFCNSGIQDQKYADLSRLGFPLSTGNTLQVVGRLTRVFRARGLGLQGNGVDAGVLRGLVEHLHGSYNLEVLDLSDNCLTSVAAVHLGRLLERCFRVHSVNLSHNNLGDEGIESLCEAFSDAHAVNSEHNKCSEGAEEVAVHGPARWVSFTRLKLLEHDISSRLQELCLKSVGLGDRGMDALCRTLPDMSLVTLDVSSNVFTDSGMFQLSATLPDLADLEVLNVSSLHHVLDWMVFISKLGQLGLRALALCNNQLNLPAFRSLCLEVVGHAAPQLKYVNVSGCAIATTPIGCRWAMDAVMESCLQGDGALVLCTLNDSPLTAQWTPTHRGCLRPPASEEDKGLVIPQDFQVALALPRFPCPFLLPLALHVFPLRHALPCVRPMI